MRVKFRNATRDTFQSLHVRNFRLFFGGQLISQIGNWLTLVTQTLLVLKLTDSGIALGLLAAAQFGPVLVIGPWAGLIADRSDKRRLLIVVQIVAMAQSFVLAGLAFSGHPPVWSIYLVALVGGVTVAFDNPARRAFVVEMVPEAGINNAVSLNSALMTGARIIGPALAGILVSTVGFGWGFALDGISYLAVIAGLWLMDPAELRPSPVTARATGQIREGLRYARSIPELWIPLAMMAVIGTLSYNFQVVFPLFTERVLHGGTNAFTLLFSVTSVGALAGALLTARRKVIDIRLVGLSAAGFGVAMGLMAVAPNLGVAFPLALLLGLNSIAFMTASTAIVQIRSAPEMRGRVLALQAMVFLGSTPIGGPIVGWISERFGARYGIGIGALAALSAGLWGMSTVRRGGRRALAERDATDATAESLAELAARGPVAAA